MKKEIKSRLIKSHLITSLTLISISPIAIALGKQIADNYQNQLFINSSRAVPDWTNLPGINTPTKEMFHNTHHLVPLSSVTRGQMVTPYGWLGKYDAQVAKNPGGSFTNGTSNNQDYWDNTLALVGWDGSIIWTNDESNVAIYSAKYNFATDTIFVVRTKDASGAGGLDSNLSQNDDASCKTSFTIHDAKTGKLLYDHLKPGNQFDPYAGWQFRGIFGNNNLNWSSNEWKKDLYYQDMITLGNGDIIWYYTPNILKLRASDKSSLTLQDFSQKIWTGTNGLAKFFWIKKSEIDDVRNGGNSSASIRPIDISSAVFSSYLYSGQEKYYPLTSPIVIPGNAPIEFNILSFVINENDKKIYSHNVWYKVNTNNNTVSKFTSGTVDLSSNDKGLKVYVGQNNNNNNNSNVSTFWTNNWSDQFNNAFLLPTRNMFDERVITFAYPYASPPKSSNSSSVSLPIFNVFQMGIDKAHASNSGSVIFNNSTKSFNFGEKIVNHYISNNLANIYPSNVPNTLKWYPWPNAINNIILGANDYANYTEQLYSRLISVSPFDNTIIYASRPSYVHNVPVGGSSNRDVFSGYSGVETSYASFWIGNSNTGNVSNFFIPNSNPSYGTISNQLVASTNTNTKSGGIYDLYKNGFWFDINSLTGQSGKLNLYFPTTGTKKNAPISGADNTVKSTPIAFISPTLTNFVAMDSLTNKSSSFIKTTINNDSFTNYITSRADLNQWFPRTYQNLTKGANAYSNEIVLNDYDVNNQSRAVATKLNSKLTDSNFFGANKKSVELFSNWQVGSTSSYNSMAVKRAQIVTKIDTQTNATPALNVTLKFNLENTNYSNPFYTDTAGIAKIKTFEYPVTIKNSSWQLLDSWSTNVRLSTFNQTNGQNKFYIRLPLINHTGIQGNYGGTFGGTHNLGYWTRNGNNGNYNYTWNAINGNTLYDNTDTPLWVEFGIDYDPENKADSTWKANLEKFENGLFTKTYPVEEANNAYSLPQGATSFNTVLDKFIKWKAENLMYGTDVTNPTNNIYSPGQICIKAYLRLNPYFAKNSSQSTLYTMPADADGTVVQVLYDSTNDIRYVYRDEYKNSRVVYKQTSPTWDENSEYGFGYSVTSDITASWENVPLNNIFTAYLTQPTSGQLNIKDTLVRDGTTATTNQMFSAKYSDDMSSIILTPKNNYLNWAKQRFSSFNQMVGRYAKFQYLLVGDQDQSQNWKDFNTNIIKDSQGKTMFDNGNYTITFTPNGQNNNTSTLPNNIQKVRFVLDTLPTNDAIYNADRIVSSEGLSLSSYSQFTSDAIALDQIPIHVDYNWLKNVSLNITNTNGYLNGPTNSNIDASSFKSALDAYQTSVLTNASTLGNLKDKLKLTYSLDQSSTYVDANELYNLLQTKWQNYTDSNLGIISLYNNENKYQNNVATKIYVKFAVKEQSDRDKYEISEHNFTQGNNIIEKTNIKYFINLQPYVNVLTSSKTSVVQGPTPNSITSFTPPTMSGDKGNGFLSGYSYDEITSVLAKFGITVEYQKSDGSWISNKSDITSYNPNTRQLKIRFKVDTNNLYNVVLSTDGTNIVSGTPNEFTLLLNVPILVTLQDNVKNSFISKNHISGNTWQINIDAYKDKTIINDIKNDGKTHAASADQATWDQLDQYLEVQYALSNETPTGATTFYNRQGLIDHLQAQTETNYNNTIWARLHLITKPNEDPKFILNNGSDTPFKLNNNNGSTQNKIKIYVQAAKYESDLDKIGAIGSTGKLQLTYPQLIQQVVDASSSSSNNLGIKIQYSLKQDIDYNANSGNDIKTSWVDQAPTSVPTGTPSLKIRIITTNNTDYEYGMGNTGGSPKVHSIDLTQLSQLVDINSKWFNDEAIINTDNTLLYLKNLNVQNLKDWENKIWDKSTAIQTDNSIKDLVQITYTIGDDQTIYTTDALVTKLQQMINDYNNSETLGIIKLWGEDQKGIKINATFSKKNANAKVIFVDDINSTTASKNITSWANTYKIQTEIDLSSYVNYVKSQKIAIVLGTSGAGSIQSFTMPPMTGTKGSGFLAGYTYDEIANRLQTLGITFKFNNNMDNIWNTKENVNTYDQTNPKLCLGVSFTNSYLTDATTKGNIIVKFGDNQLMGNAKYIQDGTLQNPPRVQISILDKNLCQLSLLAPTLVTVDINQLISQLPLEGNTKNISNASAIEVKIQTIIDATKKPLQDNGIDISDLNLEIRFSLNNLKLEETVSDPSKTEDGIWYTFDKFKDILSNSTTNYNTNNVYAKFYIKNNPKIDGIDKYLLSDTNSANINPSDLTASAKLKIYINNTTEIQNDWIFANLKLTGSQENFTITNLSDWLNSQVPGGLEVEYNAVAENNQPKADSWKTVYSAASPIDSLRNYWIRFKVKEAYVFEGALTTDPQHSQAFKLDASQIQVALKVQSSWLENIRLTGNLKDLNIDETAAIREITNASMMPVSNIIQIEYTYDGINWYIKDTFTSHLQNAAGAKDSTNWIILKEDIKARFVLNANVNNNQNPKYLLEVDGTNIDEDNGNNTGKQLISPTLNNSVKGYINLNKLVPYQAANFSVIGTDTKAFLNIKDYNNLNASLTPYSSNNLFSILYKWESNRNYEDANKVWTPGQDLTSQLALNGDYSARYFAMQFKVINNDYELYWNNQKQTNNTLEYASDENDPNKKINIKISVAITNPLSSNEINIKFLDNSNNPQWYNGNGAFQLAIQKTNQTFDSFSNFLNTWATSMPQDQKDALELVYYVANDANEEVKQKALQDLDIYNESSSDKYNVWKQVSNDTTITNLNYHLKVNDYIMLAVRIKKDQLTSDTNPNGYVLKDNNHAATDQIRAFGYKVRTDNIDVDWATLKVRNVDAAESASYGLDGYAMLDQISLKRSNNSGAATSDDYLNVSLQLNYFTEFYTDAQNQVLVSGDGSRLVKRDQTNSDQDGYYKNADGQEITDTQGQTIPILYQAGQKENGILAKPIKASSVQRSHVLVETNANSYTLELNNGESNALYSFFKFQDIAIQFTNKKGNSDPNDQDVYDYYVDKQNVAKEHEVNSQIKFPIENNKLIRYTFNSEEFINYIKEPNNLNAVYENSANSTKSPINGQSKLKYMYKVTRQEGQNSNPTELTTIGEIVNQIKTDFGSKVILKTTYTPINGASQNIANNDLSSITTLSNGDRFRIEIVSANENDLIYAQQPSPLVFTISGLYEADIDEELLQYLRVQQSGNFNGEGQFEIFVDNPYDDQDNHIPVTTLLQGYKFMVRVWNANKEVKQDWTNDYESINNLSNGDKVEWKLVAPTGAPIEKAYYNTVANMDKHNANNNTYSFSQVAKVGNISTIVVANSIGQNPTTNDYPENSGLLISGLPERISDTYTSITEEEFIRLMNVMNFGYTGINGQGNMISSRDITTIVVNTSSITREQYTMKYLIDQGYLTFYSNDIEFNWNQVLGSDGNWLISPGTLRNGDQITIKYQDPTMSSSYVWEAPTVSGLKDKSDNMSLLTYVGIGVASLATLGIFAIIYFVARNKKLKK